MSKMYDDHWLEANNLKYIPDSKDTVGHLLAQRGERPLYSISPDATAEEVIQLLEKTGISQLPVLSDGKPVGSIQEITLARVLHDHEDPEQVKVAQIMARPLPQLDVSVQLDEAYRLLLAGNTGILATENGKVVGIVTRIDLIEYWNQKRRR
jgi:cystathionine beta-synthase